AFAACLASQGAMAEDPPATLPSGGETLGVATWEGAYGQSQKAAYFEPFTKDTGIKIDVSTYDGLLTAVKDKIGGASPAQIIDISTRSPHTLSRDGQLETIESSILGAGPDGQKADDDFMPGGLTSC